MNRMPRAAYYFSNSIICDSLSTFVQKKSSLITFSKLYYDIESLMQEDKIYFLYQYANLLYKLNI